VRAGVGPPAPTEEQTKKRDGEDSKVETTKKNEDEDAMDTEQTSAEPQLRETTTHTNEHPPDQPTPVPTDGEELEGIPHAH